MARDTYPWYRKDRDCWYVWHNGQQVRLQRDKDAAFQLWHRIELGLEEVVTEGPSVATIITAYLSNAQARLKPSTLLSKRKVLDRFKAEKGQEAAVALTPAVVLVWLDRQKWGQSLRWLACCIIKTCYRWAVTAKMLQETPLSGLKVKPPRSRGAEALVSSETHEQLLRAAPLALRRVLLALYATGCRPSEVCRVEARHFDATNGVWLLDEHKTDRTGKRRIIYLSTSMISLCQELAQQHPTGPLFLNTKGNPLTPDRLRNWLFKTRLRLGISGVIPYAYRHSYATDALSRGIADALVAELLGHSTLTLHRHYAHLTANGRVLREALGRVRPTTGE